MKQPNRKIANWLVLYDNDQTSDAANVKVPDNHKYIIESFLKNSLNPKLFLVGPGESLEFVNNFYSELYLQKVKIYENYFYFNDNENLEESYNIEKYIKDYPEIYPEWLSNIKNLQYSVIYSLKNWLIGGCLRTIRERINWNIVSSDATEVTLMSAGYNDQNLLGSYSEITKKLNLILMDINMAEETWPHGENRSLFENNYISKFSDLLLHELAHFVSFIGNGQGLSQPGALSRIGGWYQEGVAEVISGIFSTNIYVNRAIGYDEDGNIIRAEINTDPNSYLARLTGKMSVLTFDDVSPYYLYSAAAIFYLHERIKENDPRGLEAIGYARKEISEEAFKTYQEAKENIDIWGEEAVIVFKEIYEESLGPMNYNVFNKVLNKLTNWDNFENFKEEFLTAGVGNVYLARLAERYLNTGDICTFKSLSDGGEIVTRDNNIIFQENDKFQAITETNLNDTIKKLQKWKKKIEEVNIEKFLMFFYESEKIKEELFEGLLKISKTAEFYCIIISQEGVCSITPNGNQAGNFFRKSSFSERVNFACASKENIREILDSIDIYSSNDILNSNKTLYNNLLIETKIK